MVQTPATVRKKAHEKIELLKEQMIITYNSAHKYSKEINEDTQLFRDIDDLEKHLLTVIKYLDKSINIIK